MDNQQSQSLKPKKDYTVDDSKSDGPQAEEQSSAGGLGGIGDKLSSVAGGGTDNQSYLDKGRLYRIPFESLRMLTLLQFTGISYLQQSITGKSGQTNETSEQGDTSHHAAVDAAHPEKISEFLRDQHGSMTKDDGE